MLMRFNKAETAAPWLLNLSLSHFFFFFFFSFGSIESIPSTVVAARRSVAASHHLKSNIPQLYSFLISKVCCSRTHNAVPRPGLEAGPFDQESSALSIRPPGLCSSNWRTRQLFFVAAILQRRGPGQLLQGFEPRIFRKPLVLSLPLCKG